MAGDLSWSELKEHNIEWLVAWAHETADALHRPVEPLPPIIGFLGEGYGEDVTVLRADQWYWIGVIAARCGSNNFTHDEWREANRSTGGSFVAGWRDGHAAETSLGDVDV